ncbi:MAG: gephyrin-like molybdotransferase Glp [Bacteroidota bacterium]
MIAVTKAKSILQSLNLPKKKVRVQTVDALGCFLAESVKSTLNVPSFDNSAMDGYAYCWEEELSELELIGESAAGASNLQKIEPGQAIRIFTGAPMPEGADSVIMQEKVKRKGGRIFFESEEAEQGKHVRYQGSQCQKGATIAETASKITPGMVSLLASVGVGEVEVFQAPKVTLIITGNEIKAIGSELKRGQIYNANGPALEFWLKNLGVSEVNQIQVRDQKAEVVQGLKEALEISDLVIFTGGISVGDYDFVKEAVEANQVQELFYKLKQRPGKPLYAGQKEEKVVFALPGNPASVLSCFMQYVKPLIHSWMGNSDAWNNYFEFPIAADFEKKIPLTQFLKAELTKGQVRVLQGQESFNLIAFGLANGFVEIPEESTEVKAGEKVKFYPW